MGRAHCGSEHGIRRGTSLRTTPGLCKYRIPIAHIEFVSPSTSRSMDIFCFPGSYAFPERSLGKRNSGVLLYIIPGSVALSWWNFGQYFWKFIFLKAFRVARTLNAGEYSCVLPFSLIFVSQKLMQISGNCKNGYWVCVNHIWEIRTSLSLGACNAEMKF